MQQIPLACFLSLIRPPGITFEDSYLQILPVDKGKCPFVRDHSDVTFRLYTRHNPVMFQELKIDDDESLFASNMDFNDPTVIYFSAFLEQPDDGSGLQVRESYMLRGDTNFIILDLSRLEAGPWYFTAAENTWYIGNFAAKLIDYLVSRGLNLKKTHLVGHSLGAQSAGVAGSALKSGHVSRITGLDPAFPLFDKLPLSQRLDPSDADFVDVIHTDAGIFGFNRPIGHVDFYPNGGISPQPGCELEVVLHEQRLLNKCDGDTQTHGFYKFSLERNKSKSKLEERLKKFFLHINKLKFNNTNNLKSIVPVQHMKGEPNIGFLKQKLNTSKDNKSIQVNDTEQIDYTNIELVEVEDVNRETYIREKRITTDGVYKNNTTVTNNVNKVQNIMADINNLTTEPNTQPINTEAITQDINKVQNEMTDIYNLTTELNTQTINTETIKKDVNKVQNKMADINNLTTELNTQPTNTEAITQDVNKVQNEMADIKNITTELNTQPINTEAITQDVNKVQNEMANINNLTTGLNTQQPTNTEAITQDVNKVQNKMADINNITTEPNTQQSLNTEANKQDVNKVQNEMADINYVTTELNTQPINTEAITQDVNKVQNEMADINNVTTELNKQPINTEAMTQDVNKVQNKMAAIYHVTTELNKQSINTEAMTQDVNKVQNKMADINNITTELNTQPINTEAIKNAVNREQFSTTDNSDFTTKTTLQQLNTESIEHTNSNLKTNLNTTFDVNNDINIQTDTLKTIAKNDRMEDATKNFKKTLNKLDKLRKPLTKRQKRFIPFLRNDNDDNFLFRMLEFLMKHRRNVVPIVTVMREINTLVKSANGELNHFSKERNNYIGANPPLIPVTYDLAIGNESRLTAFVKKLLGFGTKGGRLTINGSGK